MRTQFSSTQTPVVGSAIRCDATISFSKSFTNLKLPSPNHRKSSSSESSSEAFKYQLLSEGPRQTSHIGKIQVRSEKRKPPKKVKTEPPREVDVRHSGDEHELETSMAQDKQQQRKKEGNDAETDDDDEDNRSTSAEMDIDESPDSNHRA